MNSVSEMWNEICFLLAEKVSASFSEKDFENQVVRALEVLGWREFKGEIVRQPTIQLGRGGTLRPDLVVYNTEKIALIVLEVKRPIEDITKDNTIGQLRSYMRQMKSEFGFLVGSEIRLYYDGASNPQPDPLLLEKISFQRNLSSGEFFVKNFNRSGFLNKEYFGYLEDRIRKYSTQRQIKKLSELLLSSDTHRKIIEFLRNEFADYGDEAFSKAMRGLIVQVKRRAEATQTEKPKGIRRPTKQSRTVFEPLGSPADLRDIAKIPFENRVEIRLRHIYCVLHFMRHGFDFPSATKQTLRLFPEVQDYQTISDKCARGFAGNVDTFIAWFHSGDMLRKLHQKFDLSERDYARFKKLLSS